MVTKEEKKGEKEGRTETQKTEYLENEKSFLDKIKSIFHSFWRVIIWWKKIWIHAIDTSSFILLSFRIRIIASHFANCEVKSNYWDCKVVSFFPLKINSSKLYFCYFIYSLHTLIKRNNAHTQNYNTKCRKCFAILEKHFRLRQGKILATLDIFIAEWISNHNSNAVICVYTFDKFIISYP